MKRMNRPLMVDMERVGGLESENMDVVSETEEEEALAEMTLKDWRKGWKERLNGVSGTRI